MALWKLPGLGRAAKASARGSVLESGAGSYRPQFYAEESKIKCPVQVCRASSGSGQLVCIPSQLPNHSPAPSSLGGVPALPS